MPQPTHPSASASDPSPDRQDSRSFRLTVWPRTALAPWCAEVCAEGDALPRRFQQPGDLLQFLTQPTPSRSASGGLR